MRIILTVGISNSGKSTWAKKYIESNPSTREVNRDDIRIDLFCGGDRSKYGSYTFSNDTEFLVTKTAKASAAVAISKGLDVIISDTNLNAWVRSGWKKFAKDNDLEYEEVVFDTPFETCVRRNKLRDISIPNHVLHKQGHNLERQLTEGLINVKES